MNNLGRFNTLGEAWLAIVKHIKEEGIVRDYTDNPGETFEVRECFNIAAAVEKPALPDPVIDRYKDEKEYNWMLANFTDLSRVKELHNANSYAERFYSYMDRKNQLEWVVNRLKDNPEQRSCTITTFEPLTDEMYIPCVSMLDFQKRIGVSEDILDLNVYARALDFGSKAYVNMVMLTLILEDISGKIGYKTGALELMVKSAHYRTADEPRILKALAE